MALLLFPQLTSLFIFFFCLRFIFLEIPDRQRIEHTTIDSIKIYKMWKSIGWTTEAFIHSPGAA